MEKYRKKIIASADHYRREGAEAMRGAVTNVLIDTVADAIDNKSNHGQALARWITDEITTIRSIDLDELLAAASTWKGPGETPHRYSPDYMAQGDCQVCGHTWEAHQPDPDPVARLVEAAMYLLSEYDASNPVDDAVSKLRAVLTS